MSLSIDNTMKYTKSKQSRKIRGVSLIDVYNEERCIWNIDGITINSPLSDRYKYYMNRYKIYVDDKDPMSVMRCRAGFHILRSMC